MRSLRLPAPRCPPLTPHSTWGARAAPETPHRQAGYVSLWYSCVVDYDATDMPENYDRGRRPPPGVLEMWVDRIALALADRRVSTIVDLGCGTGRFSGLLADRFQANVLAVDPSERMLAQASAKRNANVRCLRGSGEEIPCGDAGADLIFASMAFHHFRSPDAVAKECGRVLRPAGFVCIRNSVREQSSPYEAFFPNYRLALDDLPAGADIVGAFVRNGFALRRQEIVLHTMAGSLSELADKASFRADTTLVRLSDSDFEKGLANMRLAAKTQPGPATIGIGLFLFGRSDAQ